LWFVHEPSKQSVVMKIAGPRGLTTEDVSSWV
jgi:hypothetical protein